MEPTLAELKLISMKDNPRFSERWLQTRLVESPELLGLGELVFRDKERVQSSGGRLDLLYSDESGGTWYEVEIQLGPVDETHIIRTLEYWDYERLRYQNIQHIAVIAAEEITSRFHNVISLFNRFIPIIALQASAYELPDGSISLIFTKVLDHRVLDAPDDGIPLATDRQYWENQASVKTMNEVDTALNIVNRLSEPTIYGLNYNKHYIGLVDANGGGVSTAIVFRPKKKHFLLEIKGTPDSDFIDRLEESDLDFMEYDSRKGTYRLRMRGAIALEGAGHDLLEALIQRSLQHLA